MSNQPQFTPDAVFNLISSSPQGRAFVENLARMSQLQQAAQQFAPQIQQFAQNPAQAMGQIGNWAQGAVNQMEQQQDNQNGGPPMNNMMGMAMELVGKFEATLGRMETTLTTLTETMEDLKKETKFISDDMAKVKQDVGKFTKS